MSGIEDLQKLIIKFRDEWEAQNLGHPVMVIFLQLMFLKVLKATRGSPKIAQKGHPANNGLTLPTVKALLEAF